MKLLNVKKDVNELNQDLCSLMSREKIQTQSSKNYIDDSMKMRQQHSDLLHADTLIHDGRSPTIKELDSYLEQDRRNDLESYENQKGKGVMIHTHQAVVNSHFGNLEGVSVKNLRNPTQ